jgi:regulatory protein YycH of two-component signal transduction system YycFG
MYLGKFKLLMSWVHNNEEFVETSKTVLLWILIVSSLLLTWSLWTYNPTVDTLKKPGAIESVKIEPTGTRKISEVIRPIQVIYYQGGQSYFSITNHETSNDLYEKLLESVIINLDKVESNGTSTLTTPTNFIEFVFPNDISQRVIEHLFELENKPLLISDIDRIYVFQKNVNGLKENTLRLISYKADNYVDLKIQLDYEGLLTKVEETKLKQSYFNYNVRNKNGEIEDVIYLPTKKVDISPPIKFVRKVQAEEFKLALFNELSFVNREESNNKIYFSDDKQVLSVNLDTNEMSYHRSIMTEAVTRLNDYERITKSVDFINTHYGWTDQYVLFNQNNENKKTFRLFVDGLPVFNNLGMIQLNWERGQVYEYNRSLINLSYEYTRDIFPEKIKNKVDPIWPPLMSGDEVLDTLERTNKIDSVKDIKIGYSMHKYNNSSSVYEFTPNWYYFNGEYWTPIYEELGGEFNGLEAN